MFGNQLNSSLAEAEAFTRDLAVTHYENFIVGSIFLPKEKRQHIYNIYAFARIGDDLADEITDTDESLEALEAYEHQLEACYNGHVRTPVFAALSRTIREFNIPIETFQRLLAAFKQDRVKNRYDTFDEVLAYCRNSANPIGELFLYIFGYNDPSLLPYSDAICTALQLTNFWQDVSRDAAKNRIYIPLEDLERFGVSEKDIFLKHFSENFRTLVQFEVDRTRKIFEKGKKLVHLLQKDILLDICLFMAGGEAILNKIEKQNYDVLNKRPALSKKEQGRLFLREWWRVKRGKNGCKS
ncbi:MAG: squalene synthase HpnC [Calditrichaeota bacterium]|nr:squalene synthase HpnC [Calditrichota bacterium]